MSFEIGDVVGDYQIIAVLGAGGMGKVYKVKNQISDRIDALKVLLPNLADNQELADRFIREIKVLASLNHPNIAGLRTAFRLENKLLMLMEFVEGRSLEKDTKAGPLRVDYAIDYVRQVLAALDYAHTRGVIHRDIKPANMMLTPEGVIKLMDFGIAKSSTDQKLTQTGVIIGSLFYMSPEQVRGSGLDNRSDLYSVGISLYEFVTGSRPFQGGTDFDIMMAQLQQAPHPPIERQPGVPQALNDVIMKSLEKDPAKRFQNAAEFAAALNEVEFAAQGMTSFQASRTTGLSTPSELLVTRKQITVQTPPPVQAPAAPSLASSGAQNPALSAQPPLSVEMPKPRSNFLLPAGIGVGAVAVLAVLFVVFYHPKKTDTTTQVLTPHIPASFVSRPSGDMVLVEGGDALLGPQPPKSVAVGPFYLDKTEVSNRAYLDFCRATGHTPPTGIDQSPSENPVVDVAYDDARSFCSWANMRLPTATEWEKAARGSNGQLYPWGNSFDASLANVPRDKSAASTAKLAPVTAYENGKSPYGALNMVGNVWEWVNAVAPAPTGEEFRNYQRVFRDLSPPLNATDTFYYARGGSFKLTYPNPAELTSDVGSPLPARARKPDVGFRCAMDPN